MWCSVDTHLVVGLRVEHDAWLLMCAKYYLVEVLLRESLTTEVSACCEAAHLPTGPANCSCKAMTHTNCAFATSCCCPIC